MLKDLMTDQNKNNKPKYNKSKGEHVKDIIIAILISAIISFIGGVVFQSHQQSVIDSAVKGVSTSVNLK